MTYPRGFTLLIAVIVSGILAAFGSAIFNIVSKEIVLSSSGRESQFAFYAADSGIECALYWDGNGAFSSTSPPTTISCGGGAPVTIDCTTHTSTCTPDTPGNPTLVATFPIAYDSTAESPCTSIQVTKHYAPPQTVIEAYGHNTCVLGDPLRLERAIKVTY